MIEEYSILELPLSQVEANCMALLPVPQKASTIRSQRHRSAMCSEIFSGVALNQPSGAHTHTRTHQ